MTNYIFYKIHLKVPNEELKEFKFIGHTTDFNQRKYKHKSTCNNENNKHYNLHVYKFIKENGGWDNWVMEALEEVEYEAREEAGICERYWCENEGGKRKEYDEEHKEHIQQQKTNIGK
jgi:hypothetical protein